MRHERPSQSNQLWIKSETVSSEFNRQREAIDALAVKFGLDENDLARIVEAKRQLANCQPSNRMERIAKHGLESLFSGPPPKKHAGRPSRITAGERQELRARARAMRIAVKTRREVVIELAEEYELRPSYLRRILGDRLLARIV